MTASRKWGYTARGEYGRAYLTRGGAEAFGDAFNDSTGASKVPGEWHAWIRESKINEMPSWMRERAWMNKRNAGDDARTEGGRPSEMAGSIAYAAARANERRGKRNERRTGDRRSPNTRPRAGKNERRRTRNERRGTTNERRGGESARSAKSTVAATRALSSSTKAHPYAEAQQARSGLIERLHGATSQAPSKKRSRRARVNKNVGMVAGTSRFDAPATERAPRILPLHGLVAFMIAGVAILLRAFGLHRGLWLDEYTTLVQLDADSITQTLLHTRADAHHPLYFALLAAWAKFDTSLPWLRTLGVLIDSATLLMLWTWLRRESTTAALLAMLYFACAPLFARFGLELRPYGLLVSTTVFALWRTAELARSANPAPKQFAAWTVALLTLVATHPVGVFFIPMLTLWAAFPKTALRHGARRITAWQNFALTAVAAAPAAALFVALHVWWQRMPGHGLIAWMPALSWPLVTHTLSFMGALHPSAMSSPLRILCMGASAAWVSLAVTNLRTRAWPVAFAAAGFVGLVAAYSLQETPIFWYRALMPAYVALVAFAALHTASLPEGWRRTGGVIAMLAVCILQAHVAAPHAADPLEASEAAGAAVQRNWYDAPSSMELYHPNYLEASVRAEAFRVPQSRIDSLTDPKQSSLLATADTLFLTVRVDLDVAAHPERLAAELRETLASARRARTLQLQLIPSHDLAVLGETNRIAKVLDVLTNTLGKPVPLPSSGELQLFRFRLR